MAEITATFGGLTFSNEGSSGYTLATLDGWYSGAPVRSEVEPRPNADGAFGVTRVYKGARVITLSGLILSDDAASDEWAAFAGLQSDGAPSDFSVVDASGTKTCSVTLAGPPEISPQLNGLAAYMLQLVARDPVKYGPDVVYSTGLASGGGGLEYPLYNGGSGGALYYGEVGSLGRVELSNSGTAAVSPFVTVTGVLDSGFYLQCLETGEQVRYDRVVPAGSFVSIDFRTGSVLVDGVSDASTYLTIDQFFSVAPGSTCTVQFNSLGSSSGTPMLTVTMPSGGWW